MSNDFVELVNEDGEWEPEPEYEPIPAVPPTPVHLADEVPQNDPPTPGYPADEVLQNNSPTPVHIADEVPQDNTPYPFHPAGEALRDTPYSPIDPPSSPGADDENHDGLDEITANGDLILVAGVHRMRVSSTIFSMASPQLRELLNHVLYQRSVKEPGLLVLKQEDDYPIAIWVLMHILHFSEQASRFDTLNYDVFGKVCKVAKKYGIRQVVPEDRWANSYPVERLEARDLNTLASGSYSMDNAFQFERITKVLIQKFTEAEIRNDIVATQLRDAVLIRRAELLQQMGSHVEWAVRELQDEDTDANVFDISIRFCANCRTTYQLEETAECPDCGGTEEFQQAVYCNPASRLAACLGFFQEGSEGPGIWPTQRLLAQRPCELVLQDLDTFFKEYAAQTHMSAHTPFERDSCPILEKLRDLEKNLRADYLGVEGLELEQFKEDSRRVL